jgi:hypothetical protein
MFFNQLAVVLDFIVSFAYVFLDRVIGDGFQSFFRLFSFLNLRQEIVEFFFSSESLKLDQGFRIHDGSLLVLLRAIISRVRSCHAVATLDVCFETRYFFRTSIKLVALLSTILAPNSFCCSHVISGNRPFSRLLSLVDNGCNHCRSDF